jgi:hypothetical protein
VVATRDDAVPTYTDGQDPLVYLASSTEAAAAAGLPCLFSDGNCASPLTEVFDDPAALEGECLLRGRSGGDKRGYPPQRRLLLGQLTQS